MKYLTVALAVALVWINVIPLFVRKFRRVRMLQPSSPQGAESYALKSALAMLRSRKSVMSYNEGSDLYERLAVLKAWIKRRGAVSAEKYYHYPRAFLMLGLAKYAGARSDKEVVQALSAAADQMLDPAGCLKFSLSRLDHCVYGEFFLVMHELTGNPKFLSGAHRVYERLLRDYHEDSGWLRYRTTLDAYFVDAIGMACPFLYAYSERTGNVEAASIADRQLELWHEFGLESRSELPFHGIDSGTKLGLGPVNWARGIGWYALGLAQGARLSRDAQVRLAFGKRLNQLLSTVRRLEGGIFKCRQFIGNDNDSRADSSAVMMLQYASVLASGAALDAESFWKQMTKLMNSKGEVVNCSGDTVYFSRYSSARSSSELSQGLLMAVACHVRPLADMESLKLRYGRRE